MSCRVGFWMLSALESSCNWDIYTCELCYCSPWEGQGFTKAIVPLLLEETDAMSVVGGLCFVLVFCLFGFGFEVVFFFPPLLLSMILVSIKRRQ